MICLSCDMISAQNSGTMLRIVVLCAVFLLNVSAEGEVRILVTPESLQLIGHDPVDNNAFRELFPALLGLTIEKPSNWSGLEVSSPFHYSKAAIVLVADGITSLETAVDPLVASKVHAFTLTSTENEKVVYDELKRRIEERYPLSSINDVTAPMKSSVRRIELDDVAQSDNIDELLGAEKLKFLDSSLSKDQKFLQELVALKKFINEVKSGSSIQEGIPNVYWIVMKSMKSVSDFHGLDSEAVQEAKRLVRSMAEQLTSATTAAYGKKVVVATVALPNVPDSHIHARFPREAGKPATVGNIALDYSQDYPVIFNIILWFVIVFAFSLLAVCLSIAFMDPGRDSIIYRMTSTRMKKDN